MDKLNRRLLLKKYGAVTAGAIIIPTIIPACTRGKNGHTAPSDAIILFEGGDLNNFVSVETGGPAEWKVSGKKFTVAPGKKNIQTKERFGDCQFNRPVVKIIEINTPGLGQGFF